MSYEPLISIGLPVYNGERHIRQALDSLLAQNYGDFELIISDNASTDETQQICLEYAARDERIRYYRNERDMGGAGTSTGPSNCPPVSILCGPLMMTIMIGDISGHVSKHSVFQTLLFLPEPCARVSLPKQES